MGVIVGEGLDTRAQKGGQYDIWWHWVYRALTVNLFQSTKKQGADHGGTVNALDIGAQALVPRDGASEAGTTCGSRLGRMKEASG